MANHAPGKPHPGSPHNLGCALRHAAARGAGTPELEAMTRARLSAFLAMELRRGLARAAGLVASARQSLAAATRLGPASRPVPWSSMRRQGERDGD